MTQQTLINFESPAAAPVLPTRRPSLEQRFARFVKDNPSVVQSIIHLARQRKEIGLSWWSMRAAFEMLRDRPQLITGHDTLPTGERVKLNNDFTAPMARLVMKLAPDLESFFNTR